MPVDDVRRSVSLGMRRARDAIAVLLALVAAACMAGEALAGATSCERVLTVITDAGADPITEPVSGPVCDLAAVAPGTVTMPTATGSGSASATVNDPSRTYGFSSGRARAIAEFPAPPQGVKFPHGMFELNIVGCPTAQTTQIAFTLPATLPANAAFFVFGPTADNTTPHWFTLAGSVDGATMRVAVDDGGYGDGDLAVNSHIVLIGGPAISELPASVPVPSLTRPLLLLLIAGMCGMAWMLRRKLALAHHLHRTLLFAALIAGIWGTGDLLVSAVAQSAPAHPIQLVPPTLTFPAQMPGATSPSQAITATNVSGAALHVKQVIAPDNFQQENNCGDLAANQSCTITVRFAPTSATSCAPLPPPILISLDPGTIETGTTGAPLTLTGSGFQQGAVVAFDALRTGTTSVTATTIHLIVPDSVAAVTSTPAVKVINPDGGVSNTLPLNIVPTNPPTVALISPADGTHFIAPATMTLIATAAAPGSTVSKVELFANGNLLTSLPNTPYQYSWSGVAAGHYTLTARVTNAKGATATSAPVSITVDAPANQPPVAAIVTPTQGQSFTLGDTIAISATASDIDGQVVKVELFADGILLATKLAAPYTFSWTSAAVGAHTLTARATDDQGATGTSAPVSIAVAPVNGPSVLLLAPVDHSVYAAPATMLLAASAQSPGATIRSVEFFSNGHSVGSVATAPFNLVLNNIAVGTYAISATATDSASKQASTAPVSVEVKDFGDDPDIVITSHADGQIVHADTITLFGVTKNVATLAIPGYCDPITFASNAFRATPFPLAWGDNEIVVEGVSNHGVNISRVITIRNTLPKLTITSPTANFTTDQSDIMVEGTFVAPPASIVALTKSAGLQGSIGTVNSGTGFNAKVPLHLGANTVFATLTTPDSQTVVKSVNVTRVTPSGLAIKITSPADQTVFEAAVLNVQGTVTAPADATVSVNGVIATVAGGHFSASVPMLPGFVRIAATLRRADGTSIQDSTTNVNTYPRAGPISLPADGSVINGATAPMEGIAIGPDASSIKVNGVAMTVIEHGNAGSIGPTSYTSNSHFRGEVPIVPGDNALELSVTTPNGSIDRKTIHVKGSTSPVPPTALITSPVNGAKIAPGVLFIESHASSATSRLVRIELMQDGVIVQNLDVDAIAADGNFEILSIASGNHTFVIKATERTGNVGFSPPVAIKVLTIPTVSLTSPASNAQFTVGDPITVTASTTDLDGTITRIDFFDHGTSIIRTLTTSPYSFSWTNAAVGSHSLTARLSDNNAFVITSAPIVVSVNAVTNHPPTVTLTSPTNGQSFLVGAPISLSATASDTDGTIASVVFLDGSTAVGAAVAAPYNATWANASAGTHTITAKATDNGGATAVSAAAVITVVANQPPSVSLTSPTEGQSFFSGQPISIAANASDPDGSIAKVEFLADAAVIGSATLAPYAMSWTGASVGSHTLTARATDNLNVTTTSSPVHVSVGANASPTLSLQTPRDNQSFSLGAAIPLSAIASDVDGTVARVEFYVDNALFASVATAPYIASLTGASAGLHHIYAKAIDDRGAVTTSATITVAVIGLVVNIASPAAGASIAADFVAVSGQFTAPPNSGVTVNGLLGHADLNGGFFVNNVPLVPGANTLTVVVTAPDGGSVTATRNVTSTAVAGVQISADRDVGFSPTTFTILLENRTGNPIVDIKYLNLDGGMLDPTGAGQTMLGTLTYSVVGAHSPGFTVTDSKGNAYTQFITLQVIDKAALDTVLKTLWNDFARALGARNKAAAMGYLTAAAQDNYSPVFDALSTRLPSFVAGMSAPGTGFLSDTVADLGVNRTIAGVNRIFLINLLRDQNGVWRIDGM
jgi:Bacterial Ig domain/Glucodextranase, domain B